MRCCSMPMWIQEMNQDLLLMQPSLQHVQLMQSTMEDVKCQPIPLLVLPVTSFTFHPPTHPQPNNLRPEMILYTTYHRYWPQTMQSLLAPPPSTNQMQGFCPFDAAVNLPNISTQRLQPVNATPMLDLLGRHEVCFLACLL